MCSLSKCSVSFRFPEKRCTHFYSPPTRYMPRPSYPSYLTWQHMVESVEAAMSVTVSAIFVMATFLICYFKYLIQLIVFETCTLAYQDPTVIIDHEYNNSWHMLLLIINNSSCRLRLGDAWPFVIDYERKVFQYWLHEKASYWLRVKMHDKLRYGTRRISRHWSHGISGYWSHDNSCRWSRL